MNMNISSSSLNFSSYVSQSTAIPLNYMLYMYRFLPICFVQPKSRSRMPCLSETPGANQKVRVRIRDVLRYVAKATPAHLSESARMS